MPSPQRDNLDPITAAGVELAVVREPKASKGATLANATTYYIPFPSDVGSQKSMSMYIKWASALAAVFTLEATNEPDADAHEAAPAWVQVNPSTANVPVGGTGHSSTAATVTAVAGNAGCCLFEVPDASARRWRIKAVVTTGALVRFSANGKEWNA